MNDKYITVSSLTKYIKYKIDNDLNLQEVFLKGEISNFKAHSRGHFYFTLKDEGSRINAIMFASNASKLKFTPTEGMKVLVTGKVSVYETTGAYQIYVNDMLEDGVGNLYVAFEQLKKKLEQEGLFDQRHKKSLPRIPKRIGIVTAPTGAAIRDILSTIKRRWPLSETYLFPALVQGMEAKDDVAKQIQVADQYQLDVLIVGRGGGSIEDLWCFNEEIVARAIFACKTPVISAVGHEVDFTIADFVADKRAPTPTGAAEMAVPNISDISNYLNQLQIRTNKVMSNTLKLNRQKLAELTNKYVFKNPATIYYVKDQQFSNLLDRLKYSSTNLLHQKSKRLAQIEQSYILQNPNLYLDKGKNKFSLLLSKLETLSPLLTLKRGYTIVKKQGKVISFKKDLVSKDQLELELQDGTVQVEVLS